MNVTRAVVDLRTRSVELPGVLKDIDGVLSLLHRHNEDAEATSNVPSSSNSVNGVNEASTSAASDNADGVANDLPQATKRTTRNAKKRASSISVPDEPTSKRRKPNEPAASPLPTVDETFEATHHVELYYECQYNDEATRPPNIRRLYNNLNRAWTYLPSLPSSPVYIYAPKGSHKVPLVALLEPLAKGVKLDSAKAFVTLPFVGNEASLMRNHDFSARHSDLLRAFLDLQDAQRAQVTAKLTIHPPDSALLSEGLAELASHQREQLLLVISIDFSVTLIDVDKTSPTTPVAYEAQRRVLHNLFPRAPSTRITRPTVSNFISGLQPAPSLPPAILEEYLQPKSLECQLLPFQRRSVYWMLSREGFTISKNGDVIPSSSSSPISSLWEQVSTSRGSTRYINRLNGDLKKVEDIEPEDPVMGGILAEEVGCGKTVESIALILLNSPPNRGPWNVSWNDMAQVPLHEVKTTLIVTPVSLQKQWIEEMEKHAPKLKVYVFEGWKSMKDMILDEKSKPAKGGKKKKKSQGKLAYQEEPDPDRMEIDGDGTVVANEWAYFCQKFDVVITTYNVLAAELDVARGAVERPRRDNVEYGTRSLPRSPLCQVAFWRVMMDEVQLSGGTNTVEMVSRIPRVNSFAVSGTPARATVADLLHVLDFLRVPASITTSKTWKRLLAPAFFESFSAIFDTRLAIRTCKSQVTHEFQLPKQTRYIVPVDFGPVERTIYDDILEGSLQALRVDIRGVAAHSGWEMDLASLRACLHKLRQACTHPQVGGVGKIEKIIGGKGIKTMEEVLDAMREATEDQLVIDQRKKVNLRIRHSQLLASMPEKEDHMHREIANLQLSSLQSIQEMIKEAEVAVKSHRATGRQMLDEAVTKRRERKQQLAEAIKTNGRDARGGAKGKGRADDIDSDGSDEEEGSESEDDDDVQILEEGDRPVNMKQWHKQYKWWLKTDNGKAWKHRHTALKGRQRENLVVAHKVQLLLGDIHFQLREPENEKKYYDEAENTRLQLLSVNEKTAIESMKSLPEELARITAKNANDLSGFEAPTLQNLLIDGPPRPGILTDTIFESEQEVIDILNEQTQFLFDWKEHLTKLITQKLIEDSVEGDEMTPYERALEVQQECEAFLQAYQSLLADRREALIAERTLLAATENREDKTRKTAAASKAAKAAKENDFPALEERSILTALDKGRHALTTALAGRALKTSMVQLKEVTERDARGEEIAIAKAEMNRIKRIINVQTKQMDRLDKQLAPIRKTFNDRIEYFRQLQIINDSVAAATWEEDTLEEALITCIDEYGAMERSVNARQARQRYLNGLCNIDEEEDDEPTCVLCKCEFEKGVILGCVHHFCEECIILWMAKAGNTNKFCPVCRAPIDKNTIQPIRFGKEGGPDEAPQRELPPRRRDLSDYNVMPEETRLKILNVDVISDKHGSKIMFLVKHLLWLQEEDPGAKTIVFSTWAAGLSIIANALIHNEIKYIRIDQAKKKDSPVHEFETNPEIQVLLLHGERDVSGLNITCACRCLIIEPTVNHSFEVQAIARIDRMGQTRETEVYCYAVEDTVERNILDLGAKQGLSLYTKDKAQVAMDVARLQRGKEKVDAPARSKKTGDFIASGEDMLAIMFPHLYDDFEDNADPAAMHIDQPVASSSRNGWVAVSEGPTTSA